MRSRLWAIYASLTWSCIACTGAFADDVTYSYDALGRLVRVEYASGSTIVYNYDSAGNRTSVVYNGTNGAPVANADSVSTTLNRAITFDPRANDSDPDNDPLTISNTPTASHGTVTNNSGQTLTYTPATGFPSGNTGTDFFNYTIGDGRGNTAQARVTVSITDRPPVAVPDTVGVPNGTVTTFKPLNNDSDPDSDTLTITSPTGTPMTTNAGGSVVRSGKSLIYTPPTNTPPNGEADTFSYTISDGHNNTAMATETMNIGAQNQAPTAHDDTAGRRPRRRARTAPRCSARRPPWSAGRPTAGGRPVHPPARRRAAVRAARDRPGIPGLVAAGGR